MNKFSLVAICVIFSSVNALADDFTVSSATAYKNTTTGASGNYKDKWFRPGKTSNLAGSAGFFDAKGSNMAVQIVSGTHKYTPSWYSQAGVNLGGANDATNLQNMKAALEIIQTTNEFRTNSQYGENKGALKVSDVLMAVSQIRTDWAANYQWGHAAMEGIASVAENLGNGLSTSNISAGWYSEKACVINPNSQECKNSVGRGQTGHYTNMVGNHTLTGAAYATGSKGRITGAVYGSGTIFPTSNYYDKIDFNDGIDVEEYAVLLDTYINTGWYFYNSDNTVTLSGAFNDSAVKVSGGYAVFGDSERNTVNLNNTGVIGEAHGGYAVFGHTRSNTVNINGKGAISKVYGGYASSSASEFLTALQKHSMNNTVNLSGTGTIGEVYGGYAINGNAMSNIVNFNSGKVSGTIYGGYTKYGQNYWNYWGNTLNVNAQNGKLEAGNIANFGNINFYLPSTVTNDFTALQLTGGAKTDLSKSTVSAHLSNAKGLNKNSVIHLISTNGTLNNPKSTNTNNVVNINIADLVDVKGLISLSSDNKNLNLSFTGTSTGGGNNPNPNPGGGGNNPSPNPNPGGGGNNPSPNPSSGGNSGTTTDLIGTGKAKPNTKSFLETNIASQSLVSSNADLLSTNLAQLPLARGASSYSFAQGYNSRLNSGSYVDAKGFNLNAGIASTTYFKALALTGGIFFEGGSGKYDSYLDNGTHGNGNTKSYGGGAFARLTTNSDNYASLAIRAGRIESDYDGSLPTSYNFETKSNYYGADIGLGSIFEPFKSNKLDIYAIYSYALTKGDEVDLGSGATLKFGDISSNRVKLGFTDSIYLNKSNSIYLGGAAGYEFDSKSKGEIVVIGNSYDISSPKLSGVSASGEIGYAYEKKSFKIDLGVSGQKGKSEGISGKLGLLLKI